MQIINGYQTQEDGDNADGAKQFSDYSTILPPPFPYNTAEDGGLYAVFNSAHGHAGWIKIPFPNEEIKIDNTALAATSSGWFNVVSDAVNNTARGRYISHDVGQTFYTIERASQHAEFQIVPDPVRTGNYLVKITNNHVSEIQIHLTSTTRLNCSIHIAIANQTPHDENQGGTILGFFKRDINLPYGAESNADGTTGIRVSNNITIPIGESVYLLYGGFNWLSADTTSLNNAAFTEGVTAVIESL